MMCLESKRLVYEQITSRHAGELKDVLDDPRVYVYVDDGVAPTFEQLLESFTLMKAGPPEHRKDERWVNYAVRIKDSQIAIGRVEATVIEHRAEVAYLFGADYWGKGYGSESLLWLQHLLQNNYGVSEFWATVTPGNMSSKHLLLKQGYAEVSRENMPRLASYENDDWIFCRLAAQM
jgi:RimJ/RimL family protein N-acetyltransferase